MIRLAYLGIDILLPVLDSVLKENCEVLHIYTCNTDNVTEFNTGIIERAKENHIAYTTDKITIDDLKYLKEQGCDLLLCAGYYHKVPMWDVFFMLNVHPSLLPVGRGAWPMPVSLLRGMNYGGVTIHKMDADFDTGDIVLQEKFELTSKDTLISYMEKLYDKVPEMIQKLFCEYQACISNAIPQGEGEYWRCPTEKDWTVLESMKVERADVILRAFFGYECIYASEKGRYEMIEARAVRGDNKGQMFPLEDGYLEVTRYRRVE